MSRASYRQIGGPDGYLATQTPFVGNSMSAYVQDGAIYVVKSYNTIIATKSLRDAVTWVSDDHFSQTTSRHQNLCKVWL